MNQLAYPYIIKEESLGSYHTCNKRWPHCQNPKYDEAMTAGNYQWNRQCRPMQQLPEREDESLRITKMKRKAERDEKWKRLQAEQQERWIKCHE